jgi:NAD(P) transhydrogenase subunit beta
MATGYAGVENPLFYKENTRMLFGDARDSLEAVFRAIDS